jgi:hypothetical protein
VIDFFSCFLVAGYESLGNGADKVSVKSWAGGGSKKLF